MRFGTSCIQAPSESPAVGQRAQRRSESDPPSPPAPSSEAGEGMPPARQLLHRHVQSSMNGTKVDLEITLNSAQRGSHIVMRIHRSPHNLHTQTVEYVTDDSTLDAAICTGFEIAQAVIDGRPCSEWWQHTRHLNCIGEDLTRRRSPRIQGSGSSLSRD